MVVQGILALALALPTGLLFGVGYGTGVRIGYEQVYPLLFPKDKDNRNVTPTVNNIKQINGIYNAIGGKEASQMGIAMGLQGAMEEIDRNPDFQALEALELRLSGRTQSRLGKEEPSKETSISDFPLGSSADPNSPNFDPEYYIFLQKQKAENAPLPSDLGNKDELNTEILKDIPSAKTLEVAQDKDWIEFSTEAGLRKSNIQKMKEQIRRDSQGKLNYQPTQKQKDYISLQRRVLIRMSNRFRDPNNNIRENALRLRRELASGQYKI